MSLHPARRQAHAGSILPEDSRALASFQAAADRQDARRQRRTPDIPPSIFISMPALMEIATAHLGTKRRVIGVQFVADKAVPETCYGNAYMLPRAFAVVRIIAFSRESNSKADVVTVSGEVRTRLFEALPKPQITAEELGDESPSLFCPWLMASALCRFVTSLTPEMATVPVAA